MNNCSFTSVVYYFFLKNNACFSEVLNCKFTAFLSTHDDHVMKNAIQTTGNPNSGYFNMHGARARVYILAGKRQRAGKQASQHFYKNYDFFIFIDDVFRDRIVVIGI